MNTNKLGHSIIFAIMLGVIPYQAIGANYYVNPIKGSDTNDGRSRKAPWQSLQQVNASSFQAGDKIFLKSGSIFRGELIPPSSGSSSKPIIFSAYGSGSNPEIRRTELFSAWTIYADSPETGTIWQGSLEPIGIFNSAGATMSDGAMARINAYSPCVRWDQLPTGWLPSGACQVYNVPTDFPMENETFYAPLNSRKFFIRNDAGNPGDVEVGAREYAIHINGVNNIVIKNIDAFGPAGKSSNGCCSGYVPVLIENADNVSIKNLEIHGANGIGVTAKKNTTTNVYFSGLHAYDNGGTALYLSSVGGQVINSQVHDNGRLSKDIGDRGGIGSNGGNLLIDGNEVYRNGQDTSGLPDFEISIVGGVEPVTISNNYLHDCLQGCIQIAEGSDNSVIENNTIVGFATSTGTISSAGKLAGIRIGGGSYGSRNTKIRNNHIEGGALAPAPSHAAVFISGFDNSGVEITGNTFYNNAGTDVSVNYSAIVDNAVVNNNSYQNAEFTQNWDWRGILVNSLADWQTRSGGWDSVGSEEVIISP